MLFWLKINYFVHFWKVVFLFGLVWFGWLVETCSTQNLVSDWLSFQRPVDNPRREARTVDSSLSGESFRQTTLPSLRRPSLLHVLCHWKAAFMDPEPGASSWAWSGSEKVSLNGELPACQATACQLFGRAVRGRTGRTPSNVEGGGLLESKQPAEPAQDQGPGLPGRRHPLSHRDTRWFVMRSHYCQQCQQDLQLPITALHLGFRTNAASVRPHFCVWSRAGEPANST